MHGSIYNSYGEQSKTHNYTLLFKSNSMHLNLGKIELLNK